MSVSAAVQVAVWGQLSADGRNLPTTGQEVMGTDLKYSTTTIRSFLLGVSARLSADTPSLNFQWTTLDPNTCVTDTVMTLCGYIASATT